MEKSTRVLAFVLAGGEGRRLAPLTRHTAKPAVPFHTSHRLIDFALSNLRNSGIRAIHVLMQYQPQSVLQHLMACWRCGRPDPDGFINPILGGVGGLPAFGGTADAVYQNRQQIIDFCPDVVAIFSADHIYRMDVRQMIDYHLACGADVTVAALPVPLEEARSFGVIEAAAGGRIRRFVEKPQRPRPMPGCPDRAFASMGNYLFSPRVLLEALEATHAAGGTDFGGHLLPTLVESHRLMAYDFTTNRIDGMPAGCHAHYWRDVGTLDAYFAAQMDTLGAAGRAPRFDILTRCWPIRGGASASDAGRREWSLGQYQCLSSIAHSARVEESILRPGASIADHAEVSRCILGDNVEVGPGCRLRNVIIEADNKVPAGFEVGFEPDRDHEWLPVSEGGVVVIPRGYFNTTVLTQAVSAGVGRGAGATITPIGVPTGLAAATGKQAALAGSGANVMAMMPSLAAGAAPAGARRRDAAEPQPSTQAARA
jgi:glucose-1-phosphate adenylyltransferase